jgi:hypothetical protein
MAGVISKLISFFDGSRGFNTKGGEISLRQGGFPDRQLFEDLLATTYLKKSGTDYQDSASFLDIKDKVLQKVVGAENLPVIVAGTNTEVSVTNPTELNPFYTYTISSTSGGSGSSVQDVVGKTNGDTLEVNKINVLNLTSDASFSLPTPSLFNKGKLLIVTQGTSSLYKAEIFGATQGSVIISDSRDVTIFNCVYDEGDGGSWVAISRDDSKICPIPVIVESTTHIASVNENISANAQSVGNDIEVTIPSSKSEGRMIYIYYPTGSPSSYVVNLTGGYTAELVQGDWFLLRDNGSFWVAIGSSQNIVDISGKLNIDGSNANQDIDIGNNSLNAKHFKVNGTGGAGHIGFKHQSGAISATASESSLAADSLGNPIWKNDGNALQYLELTSNKNVNNGYAGLDSTGKLSTSVLPDLAVVDYLGSVVNQSAMLVLTGQKGDWCIRQDTGTTFIITGSSPSLIGSWTELAYPAASVVNVVGTTNRITVSGGATKTIDIASTYIGQSSITTVGALTSGSLGIGFTPISDAQIASAATWNGKFNTPTGLNTNRLLKWNGTALVDSIFTENGNLQGNTNYSITNSGTSGGTITFGGSASSTIEILSTNTIRLRANNGASINNSFDVFNAAGSFNRFRLDGASIYFEGYDSSNVVYFKLNPNGFAIGPNTINSLTQLDLQATNKGLGLNLVSGNLGTNRNGLVWYDSTNNLFKGIQNSTVVNLIAGSGLTTNNSLKWNGANIVNANETDDGITITSTLNRVFTGAGASSNGTGANSNKFRFDGINTIATASFVQLANEQQVASSGVGSDLRGNLFLDGRANTSNNSVGYSQLYINSGGDVISDSKNSLAIAIRVNHRSTDSTNGNQSAIIINAVMNRPTISTVNRSNAGVNHITSVNADNYSSIVQTGTGGSNPIHYNAYSQRNDAIGFQHYKDATVNSGILNGNRNVLLAGSTTFSNGFGFQVENTFLTSNVAMIVGLNEEYIVQNVGTGTTTGGKRYRHVNTSNGVASAYIMGLYANGVVIGNTTSLPNTACQLDLVSTTQGLGLNLVNTNLSTTRNGLIWYHSAENVYKGIQNASVVTFATTLNTDLTVQFGWKYSYTANTSLYQMLNDTGSTKWIAVDACSVYAITLNFGTAPTSPYQVFYNKNGTGWTSFNATDTAANTQDVGIKPSTPLTLAANDIIQFRLNQGADGVSMNVIIKS